MKYPIACLAAISIASVSFAITPGSSAAVTLAVTASIEVGGFKVVTGGETTYESENVTSKTNSSGDILSETTEYKSSIVPVRHGNADILTDLNDNGYLPDGTISGWSIISVTAANATDDTGPSIYAVKKGQEPVAIDISVQELASASAHAGKYTYDYVKQTESISGGTNYKDAISLSIYGFSGQGIVSGSDKYVSGSLGKGADAVPYGFYLEGAVKGATFSGTYWDTYVAEGSISIAAAKVVDLETLGFAPLY